MLAFIFVSEKFDDGDDDDDKKRDTHTNMLHKSHVHIPRELRRREHINQRFTKILVQPRVHNVLHHHHYERSKYDSKWREFRKNK